MGQIIIALIFLLTKIFSIKGEEFKYPFIYNIENAPTIYAEYVNKYNKTFYGQNDYERRYKNFVETLKKINKINSEPDSKKVGPNRLADLSYEDLVETTKKIDPELRAIMKTPLQPNVKSLFKFSM